MIAVQKNIQFFQKVWLLVFGMGVTTFRTDTRALNTAIQQLAEQYPELWEDLDHYRILSDYPIHDNFDQAFDNLAHEPYWIPALWWKPVLDEGRMTSGYMVYWPAAQKLIESAFKNSPTETATFLNLGVELRQSLGFDPDLTWLICDDHVHAFWLK